MTTSLTGNTLPYQQYFIGSFDGRTFENDCSEDTKLWVDYGPDSYAGIVYNQLPDGRRIFISWMNKREYADHLNFNIWNGQMGLPRELKFKHVDGRTLLSSLPVRELTKLRTERLVKKRNVPITNKYVYKIAANRHSEKTKHLLDIEMSLDMTNLNAGERVFDIVFSDKHDKLKICYNEKEFILDRSEAGRTNFPIFTKSEKAERLSENNY